MSQSYVNKVVYGKALSVLALALSLAPASFAQDAVVTALKQKYRLSEINSQGVVANPGTVLTIEADGINAEPYPTMITFENPVVDGQVKQRSKGLGFLKSSNLQILQPGQKVYITKINDSSDAKEDSLKVTILTTDAVLATFGSGYGQYRTSKRYSTTLAFKLPAGTLAHMSPEDAAKTIEAVLSVNQGDQVRARDSGTVARSCEPHCAVSTTTGTVVGNAVVAPTAPAAAAPTIGLGQTPEQVTAILGAPSQIIDLGAKKIYKYPDMKIIFTGGKVSDVQ
ncbi:hypothetical protein [Terriglobus roseus]|uniref:Uncharacterized protein n=1 Tax=Terriglobus roseus TaxID=392734 RepID=A0A1G7K0U2_9BACT|nr:hypothetical protein [Terriglobus roseus]SDF30843.1 hypothetical protein SAMN05444167_2020 [Terriglobus roseus]